MPGIILAEAAAPSTPSSGYVNLYAKSDGLLYFKDDAGTEHSVEPEAVPDADTTTKGIVELATEAEVNTGTDTARVPSVSSLQNGKSLALALTSASGASFSISGIPAWAKKVTISFIQISTSAGVNILVQGNVAGSPETTGYDSGGGRQAAGNTVEAASTAGFVIASVNAANAHSGAMVLTRADPSSHMWSSYHSLYASGGTNLTLHGGGSKTFAGALNGLTFSVSSGTFDGGSIGVLCE